MIDQFVIFRTRELFVALATSVPYGLPTIGSPAEITFQNT